MCIKRVFYSWHYLNGVYVYELQKPHIWEQYYWATTVGHSILKTFIVRFYLKPKSKLQYSVQHPCIGCLDLVGSIQTSITWTFFKLNLTSGPTMNPCICYDSQSLLNTLRPSAYNTNIIFLIRSLSIIQE